MTGKEKRSLGRGLSALLGEGAEPALAMKPAAPLSHAPVGSRPIKPEVEVTGCPALVIHCAPFHRAEVRLRLNGKRHVSVKSPECNSVARRRNP